MPGEMTTPCLENPGDRMCAPVMRDCYSKKVRSEFLKAKTSHQMLIS